MRSGDTDGLPLAYGLQNVILNYSTCNNKQIIKFPLFVSAYLNIARFTPAKTAMNMFYSSRQNNSYNMTSKPEREILS